MIEIRITPFHTVYTKNCNNFSVKREIETTTLIVKHEEIITNDYQNPLYEEFDLVGFSTCSVVNGKCQQEVFVNAYCTFRFEEKEGETHFIFSNSYTEPKKVHSITEPVKMSDELCEFFKLPSGSTKSRIDIIQLMNGYIKEHKLKNHERAAEFIPNEKLQKFFGNESVKYMNMASFLKKHYSEIE